MRFSKKENKESKNVGQLLQLLSEARSAGVLGDLVESMDVQKGSGTSMNDSSKRRACQEQPVPDSDSEDGQEWEVPEVEIPQVISKEIWGEDLWEREHEDHHSRWYVG